jgi:hypothetical protein
VVVVVGQHLPAWCERRADAHLDGRYVVACYYTRDGHPVSKARAERVELTEYAPDGTPLRVQEGVVDGLHVTGDDIVFSSSALQFSR